MRSVTILLVNARLGEELVQGDDLGRVGIGGVKEPVERDPVVIAGVREDLSRNCENLGGKGSAIDVDGDDAGPRARRGGRPAAAAAGGRGHAGVRNCRAAAATGEQWSLRAERHAGAPRLCD